MDLAGRKVPSNYPLNGTVFGAGSKTPAFFAEGAAATGQQRGMVTARHLLLDAAAVSDPHPRQRICQGATGRMVDV